MAQYVYNPSKKVTQILSNYLEFDPEELKLGIWSGDLTLKNVQLKEDAFYPLLNTSKSAKDERPPLKIKIVDGRIGFLRIRIPWQRLVWGQGDVQVDLKDVKIVLGLESAQETKEREQGKNGKNADDMDEEFSDAQEEEPSHTTSSSREEKQAHLREAEHRLLQQLPLENWLASLRKQSEEMTAESSEDNGNDMDKLSRFEKWMRRATTSFSWRFCVGLQANIDMCKISVLQDGIEMGIILPELQLLAGNQCHKHNRKSKAAEGANGDNAMRNADEGATNPPVNLIYQGEYDDGEHIDKQIKFRGFATFVRTAVAKTTTDLPVQMVPLTPDDYIVKPMTMDLSFSFFYPYPLEQRKRKLNQDELQRERERERLQQEKGLQTPTISGSGSENTSSSSKRRRGKRDKIQSCSATADTEIVSSFALDNTLHSSMQDSFQIDDSSKKIRLATSGRLGKNGPRLRTPHNIRSRRSNISVRSSPLVRPDDLSTAFATAISVTETLQLTARFDAQATFGEIILVCSSRHFELINNLLAAGTKIRNGRPTKTIASVVNHQQQGITGKVVVKAPIHAFSQNGVPSPGPTHFQHDVTGVSRKFSLRLGLSNVHKERSEVIKDWWRYSFEVVCWELRKRRRIKKDFRGRNVGFDWHRQKHRRAEYVNLYISFRLDKQGESYFKSSNIFSVSPEEELLKFEDDLAIEQILLYRSIARALRVRGIKKMPSSLLSVFGTTGSVSTFVTRQFNVQNKDISSNLDPIEKAEPSTNELSRSTKLLSIINRRCDTYRRLRSTMDELDDGAFLDRIGSLLESHSSDKVDVTESSMSGSDDTGNAMLESTASSGSLEDESLLPKPQSQAGSLAASTAYSHETPVSKKKHARRDNNFDARTMMTINTSRSKSGLRTVAGSMVDSISRTAAESEPKSALRAAKFSVSVFIKSVELMVVEDLINDTSTALSRDKKVSLSFSNSSCSSDDVSELSVTPEDEKFFREQEVAGVPAVKEQEKGEKPILSCTDFLLFGLPKKVLLHMTFAPLRCSVLGRSGGSKNFNISIGRVTATGKDSCRLLAIGKGAAGTPVPEVRLGGKERKRKGSLSKKQRFSLNSDVGPNEAISFSVVMQKGHNILQTDVSHVYVYVELYALMNLIAFTDEIVLRSPGDIIPMSSLDNMRMFVHRQKATSHFDGLNVSCRVHGCEMSLPLEGVKEKDLCPTDSESSRTNNSDNRSAAKFRADILEFYSGTAVDELCATNGWLENGALEMLNISDLVSSRGTISSHHSVFTISGIDCYLRNGANSEGFFFGQQNILENPVDIEMLLINNGNTVLLAESPRQELIAEASAVHLLVSESRLRSLSQALTLLPLKSKEGSPIEASDSPTLVPPRFETLSRLILNSSDFSFRSIRCTLMNDDIEQRGPLPSRAKQVVMEESITDFLSIVSCLDVDFPNEDVMAAAMQICIDRLVGVGLSSDDAWECSNTALLKFVEDETYRSQHMLNLSKLSEIDEDISGESERRSERDSAAKKDIIETALHNAATFAAGAFIEAVYTEDLTLDEIVVLDLPSGMSMSVLQSFYDFHLSAEIPSLFLTNAAGIHLLRILPPDNGMNNAHSNSDCGSYNSEKPPNQCGVFFSTMSLDKYSAFGKGELPLSALGRDDSALNARNNRMREALNDVEFGDIECLFSAGIYDKVINALVRVKELFPNGLTHRRNTKISEKELLQVESSYSIKSKHFSVLLASEEVVPFCRLQVECLYLKNESLVSQQSLALRFAARSLSLIDLTPAGRLYPDVITLLSQDTPDFHLLLKYVKYNQPWKVSSEMYLEFRGVRIFFLRRFLNELLQYFLSGEYGIGWLLKKKSNSEPDEHSVEGNRKPPFSYKVAILDSSVLFPRCCSSNDIASIEAEKVILSNSHHVTSFCMPTESTCFVPVPDSYDFTPSSLSKGLAKLDERHWSKASSEMDSKDCYDSTSRSTSTTSDFSSEKPVSRMNIQLQRVRLFTALLEDKASKGSTDSPLFRYFCAVRGRAVANQRVYFLRPEHKESIGELESPLDENRFNCRWKELTTGFLSLDVYVDYVPQMRLLITDPVRCDAYHSPSLPMLDVTFSQFCMLLSIWYGNMQELPLMFPYDADQILCAARSPVYKAEFPEYGTEAFVKLLERILVDLKSEVACVFRNLSMRCTFDKAGYFAKDPESLRHFSSRGDEEAYGVRLSFRNVVLHVTSDLQGIMRIGLGSSLFEMIDERRGEKFQGCLTVGNTTKRNPDSEAESSSGDSRNRKVSTWADLKFGLRNNCQTLQKTFSQPFQLSVFLTKSWSLINLGGESADAVLVDFSPIWFFLDYFISYFSDEIYGNPGFGACDKALKTKSRLKGSPAKMPPGLNTDFHLWLTRPHLCVPCDPLDPFAPSLCIESVSGFWYRIKKMDAFASQEMASTGLDLIFSNEFLLPRKNSDRHRAKKLIEGFSFGLRLDKNHSCNHTDVSLRTPFNGDPDASCSISSHEMVAPPVILASPTICTPVEQPSRLLGTHVCEITCIIEVLPLASSVLVNLITGPVDVAEDTDENRDTRGDIPIAVEGSVPPDSTFSLSAALSDLRLFTVDPVLGVHLPVAVLSISSLKVTASQLGGEKSYPEISRGESAPEDLQVALECHFWGDYFKLGVTRSWEPLLEPCKCILLYEKSRYRGSGMSLNADSPLHLNISGALLLIVDEVIESFSRLIKDTFSGQVPPEEEFEGAVPTAFELRDRIVLGDTVKTNSGEELPVVHEIPKPLEGGRVAFLLRNLTGQQIRIHQKMDRTPLGDKGPAVVTYLKHAESTSLSFDATISVVKNLSIVEVPYPGLPHSKSLSRVKGSTRHAVDIQIPGFRWLQSVKIDTFGRKFASFTPRSPGLFEKIQNDWRLRNAMKLLIEVGLDNGGRLVTIRSLFEVRNNTTHPIALFLHPDPTYKPVGNGERNTMKSGGFPTEGSNGVSLVKPGDFFQVPTLLLESGLCVGGSHLGSLWFSPHHHNKMSTVSLLPCLNEDESRHCAMNVDFCSRPVQLAKLVHESAVFFRENDGDDVPPEKANSGIQISCPIKRENGDSIAPFCYVIEVGRSPLVRSERQGGSNDLKTSQHTTASDQTQNQQFAEKKGAKRDLIHGPVAYTLSLHAPFVITNLLPETGRFELMHAVRRTVLWFGDLKPGQHVPVHSVGLDAPLLLLMNLGFCRTPVGEGALVHHGADTSSGPKEALGGLKSLVGKAVTTGTKAVTKGTKQISKTLTAISDSPDKKVQDQQILASSTDQRTIGVNALGLDTGGIEAVDGKVHTVERTVYLPSDVADETAVVDSAGQRLTLNIENIRGGGGQRRIAVYCPFWIVNTTEHALRYKQEKSISYVSGTVVSEEKDGSKPVDGSTRNYVNHHEMATATDLGAPLEYRSRKPMNQGTVFSGTPGALATSPGACDLPPSDIAQLIDKDLPLEKLANIAFMFNFHGDVLSMGQRKLCVQLADRLGTMQYVSDWSRGFSLDSVGFSQIVALQCKEGRALELSVVVNVAPQFLSGYTKIVRFLPRYVLVNQLGYPVRVWQDSSVIRPISESRTITKGDDNFHGNETRQWRFSRDDNNRDRINQYETLWGRVTALEERKVDEMPEETTAHRSALYITTAGSSEFVPFHLPDSRGERQLRIGLGGTWNLTASFASDFPGDHTLKVSRAVDLRVVRHVTTRASPQYKVILPPSVDNGVNEWDGELGVWFETDWGRKVIVKGTKRGHYSYNETDIHPGDELLRIDGKPVSKMSFTEVMKLLKQRLAQVSATRQGCAQQQPPPLKRRLSLVGWGPQTNAQSVVSSDRLVLTFRTFEERFRRVRLKVAKKRGGKEYANRNYNDITSHGSEQLNAQNENETKQHHFIRIEMKPLHHSMFVVLRPQDDENPPFRIENRSINHIVFYRQRGCEGHPWNHLLPGNSLPYSWEEPMKTKKLVVRTADYNLFRFGDSYDDYTEWKDEEGNGIFSHDLENQTAHRSKLKQLFSYQYVDDEEKGGFGSSTTVKLEEIGSQVFLSCPYAVNGVQQEERWLNVQVDTDGATRILVVSDDTGEDEKTVMHHHLETLTRQIAEEEERVVNLSSLKHLVVREGGSKGRDVMGMWEQHFPEYVQKLNDAKGDESFYIVESLAKKLVEDYSEESMIKSRHQVIVEVIEAVGLNPENEIGSCNPYCEVAIKGRSRLRKSFAEKRRQRRKTYYLKKCLAPKWTDQSFVFGVPREAVSVTRGHEIRVRVRSFRLVGRHPILGEAVVHLHAVRNQQESVGWYPLSGRFGRQELENPLSYWGRGSVKLRVHWVYSVPAFVDYFILMAEKRLSSLKKSRQGMKEQLRYVTALTEKKKKANMDIQDVMLKQQATGQFQAGRASNLLKEAPVKESTLVKRNKPFSSLLDPRKMSNDRRRWVSYFQSLTSKVEGSDDMQNEAIVMESGTGRLAEEDSESSDCFSLPFEEEVNHTGSRDTSVLSHKIAVRKQSQDSSASLRNGNQRRRFRSAGDVDGAFNALSRIRASPSRSHSLGPPDRAFQTGMKRQSNTGVPSLAVDKLSKAEHIGLSNELVGRCMIAHKIGHYFHQDYLFRELEESGNGIKSSVRCFTEWQTAQALLNDDDIEVKAIVSQLQIQFKETTPAPNADNSDDSVSRRIAREKLELPICAPVLMSGRARLQAQVISNWRNQFERASRRALRSVLNPGGWLTIRPITALNLRDSYTGMYVKLRYGSDDLVSATVDAKVTPTWTPQEIMDATVLPNDADGISTSKRNISARNIFRKSQKLQKEDVQEVNHEMLPEALNMDNFHFYDNDLHVHVEPQKTSGSIRLSVIGERLNSKTELGVLHIPLGAAIATCIECTEDFLDSFHEGNTNSATPMYVRWFPLMSPKDTVPVEGDMGLSSRPPETEKLGDNRFRQYFAPCIQLALMWWPDDQGGIGDDLYDDLSEEGDGTLNATRSPEEGETSLTMQYFNADIGRVSAALIDSERAVELLSFSALDIDIRYSVTKTKTRMGLVVGWVQLDHQDDRTREPVVLAPTPQEHVQPTIQLLVVKDNLRSKKNIASYEQIGLTVEELDLTIEETWLFDLWEFFINVARRREVQKKASRISEIDKKADDLLTTEYLFTMESTDTEGQDLLSLLEGENKTLPSAGKVYIEQLLLGLLKINLSYVKGKKQNWEMTEKGAWVVKNIESGLNLSPTTTMESARSVEPSELFLNWSQHTHTEDLWAEGRGKRSQNLKGIIGAVMPNVSDAPIRLQGKVLDNVFESPREIFLSISKFYNTETLRQVYKIIGSLDFVGNPTMLFSSFVSGVRDLVVTPSLAFLRSPTNPTLVGMGVAKGTLSLFSHSTSGILAFLAKMTATAGQAAAILSLDAEYREWHRDRIVIEATNLNREYKRRGVQSMSEIITRPVGDILLGVFMGSTGVVVKPYKGFRKGGTLGFAKGIAIGSVGVVAKPLVGILDAFAHFTASVHDIAKSVNILERRYQPALRLRLPYTFGLRNVLNPFDAVEARSIHLLKLSTSRRNKACANSATRTETLIAAEVLPVEPGVDTYAIVTTLRVVLVKVKKESDGILSHSLCWEVSFRGADVISSKVLDHGHNGLAMTITRAGTQGNKLDKKRSRMLKKSSNTGADYAFPESTISDRFAFEKPFEYDSQGFFSSSNETLERVYQGFGLTRGSGDGNSEWFTLLAEYQNLKQLTRLHNAICCITKDFDSLMYESGTGSQERDEGYTAFGQFQFDKNNTDETAVEEFSSDFISSLEQLPWMHERMFDISYGKSEVDQRKLVEEMRRKWTFSDELEASISQGGQAWLIEARAHAMFVPTAAPMLSLSLRTDDPVVKEILYQQKHGNISCEHAEDLINHHKEELKESALILSSTEFPGSVISDNDEERKIKSGFTSLDTKKQKSFPFTYPDHSNQSSFYSTQLEHQKQNLTSKPLNQKESSLPPPEQESSGMLNNTKENFQARRNMNNTIEKGDFPEPVPNEPKAEESREFSVDSSVKENVIRRMESVQSEESADCMESMQAIGPSNSASESKLSWKSGSRLDRMEALMEQLVVFNSNLALLNADSDGNAQNRARDFGRSSASGELQSLRQEITSLREQLADQSRNQESSSSLVKGLRDEIASLRGDLLKQNLVQSNAESKPQFKQSKIQRKTKAKPQPNEQCKVQEKIETKVGATGSMSLKRNRPRERRPLFRFSKTKTTDGTKKDDESKTQTAHTPQDFPSFKTSERPSDGALLSDKNEKGKKAKVAR